MTSQPPSRSDDSPVSHAATSLAPLCPYAKSHVFRHPKNPWYAVLPIRCKRWTCPVCSHINRSRLIARITTAAPTRFITLTCDPANDPDPYTAYKRHRKALSKLLAKYKRLGLVHSYVIVAELTKKGWPHFHVAYLGKFIPQRKLADDWYNLTRSRIADIRRIRNPDAAAAYVAKYITKATTANTSQGSRAERPYAKAITFSKNWPKLPPRPHPSPAIARTDSAHPSVLHQRLTAAGLKHLQLHGLHLYVPPDDVDQALSWITSDPDSADITYEPQFHDALRTRSPPWLPPAS